MPGEPRGDAVHAPGAWDDRRPPSAALIGDCVHCGFCLPACPTYDLWQEEMDSPRGRIQLMQLGHEVPELSAEMVGHFDACLGCMACMPACPSGVRYDLLLQETRAQVERNARRRISDRAFRALIFSLFPHPGRLRALVPLLVAQRALRLQRLVPARLPRLRALAELATPVRLSSAWRRMPAVVAPVGRPRGRVALLQGCVQRVFFAGVNRATAEVLAAEGYEVHVPRAPRCCGSLQQHTGYESGAQAAARQTVQAFAGHDTVIVNAAGCGSGMKDYGHLIGDDACGQGQGRARVPRHHRAARDAAPGTDAGRLPRRLPPCPCPGHPRAAPRASRRHPRARAADP